MNFLVQAELRISLECFLESLGNVVNRVLLIAAFFTIGGSDAFIVLPFAFLIRFSITLKFPLMSTYTGSFFGTWLLLLVYPAAKSWSVPVGQKLGYWALESAESVAVIIFIMNSPQTGPPGAIGETLTISVALAAMVVRSLSFVHVIRSIDNLMAEFRLEKADKRYRTR
eukprot:TRINITY_DN54_c0_g1_i1.p1 TRINITY_DN54_c0_g1~~TRINITY_DN54_c0_g1_i1.p1  ORF type:complete len:169 (-),score=14.73 TRINITY_DN54_c0_g1_i1:286-792(-)